MSKWIIAVAVGIGLAGIVACAKPKDPSLVEVSGHVEATDVRVATKIAGRLVDLVIQEGDVVEQGKVLGRIDPVDVDLSLRAAKAEMAQAGADLKLKLAGARPEEIAEAEASVARADADLAGAQRELQRQQGLLDSGSGTTKARDDATTRRDVAAAALRGAKEQHAKLRAGFRKEEIEGARGRVAAAEARIAQLEQQLSDATILSPVAGVVTEKLAERGELLAAGAAIAIVTDLGDAWLNVYVAEPDLAGLRLGQEVEVVTDSGQSRPGKITYVSSKAEFTPKNVQTRDERVKLVFKVKIGLDNKDGLFKPGMPAEARFRLAGARA